MPAVTKGRLAKDRTTGSNGPRAAWSQGGIDKRRVRGRCDTVRIGQQHNII